ncbi:MAG: phosphatidic acid phosphatase [Clostridia bacterium]|nr:phosphatidic acid phosphatase [Clostridia bacterium]
MTESKKAANYKDFKFCKLNTDEFRHLKLLLYWPLFGLMFLFAERIYKAPEYYSVYCFLDDAVPFCEFFLIPYLFWFVYLVGALFYTLLTDTSAFRKMMWFIIITYTISIIIYLLFPTCQQLRPESFMRDNVFTRFLMYFYKFDTNTNVCPSIHVIGSASAMLALLGTDKFSTLSRKTAVIITALLICASTVFLKQHSVIDIIAAVPVCIIGYILCYSKTFSLQALRRNRRSSASGSN